MQRKTLVQQASEQVQDFVQSYEKLRTRMLIEQKSERTIENYTSVLSSMVLHYGKLPEVLTQTEVDTYLATKVTYSKSMLKHIVCGLRYYFKAMGMDREHYRLPSVKKVNKLPQVLNYAECKRLFKAPEVLKHRVLLSLIYSAGLRSREVSSLRIEDIDSHRMLIHIRQSKNSRDRYIPLSTNLLKGLQKYYLQDRPEIYWFNGCSKGEPLSAAGISYIVHKAAVKAGLLKHVTTHTLRHTYATHLLEMGMNILRVKELLGHSDIRVTMIYLHLINPAYEQAFSPFDKLYTVAQSEKQV
jgi:site-specific recombinase XerD